MDKEIQDSNKIGEIGKVHDNQLDESSNQQNEVFIPINIFSNGASGLESISEYLKNIGMRYCRIAELLNRDNRTIWGACKGAEEKAHTGFDEEESSIRVPVSIFRNRDLSVLEALTEYLKETMGMRYCKIAGLLNKDQRTIWTVYSRAKKKRKLMSYGNNMLNRADMKNMTNPGHKNVAN